MRRSSQSRAEDLSGRESEAHPRAAALVRGKRGATKARILLPSPSGYIAVADDSSPDARRTHGEKIAIYAEIRPEFGLAWYFELLRLFGPSADELKSAEVLERFGSLTREAREFIWSGLRSVPIHVSDPRAEVFSLRSGQHESLIRRGVPSAELRPGTRLRATLDATVDKFAAELLIMRSAVSRAALLAEITTSPMAFLGINEDLGFSTELKRNPIIIPACLSTPGGRKRKSDLAAHISAASSIAIAPAIEALETEITDRPFLARCRIPHTISAIAGPYGYDRGNDAVLEGADDLRQQSVDQLWRQVFTRSMSSRATSSTSLASEDSFLVQASDIAVGFARRAFEERGLPGACLHFDVVYLDGKRVGLSDAEEHERLIRALSEPPA